MKTRSALTLLMLALPLAACGDDLSRTFGFSRDAPDEFQVTTRAPLSVPPEFDVRPPRPGAPRPQEQSQRSQAQDVLSPDQALDQRPRAGTLSAGQAALVQQAGPPVTGDIRGKIDSDSQLDRGNRTLTDRLLFWKDQQPGTVVDPSGESRRIRTNTALGQPVTSGDTPIEQPKEGGFLHWLGF